MWKKFRLWLADAVVPHGFMVVRDYTRQISYVTLESGEYKWLTDNTEAVISAD